MPVEDNMLPHLNLSETNDNFINILSKYHIFDRTGRKEDEQRKIFLKSGVISHAKGSAYVELGDTKVRMAGGQKKVEKIR